MAEKEKEKPELPQDVIDMLRDILTDLLDIRGVVPDEPEEVEIGDEDEK